MITRLLMTANTFDGTWMSTVELIRAVQSHGVKVALATMGRALSNEQLRQVRALEHIELFESIFALEWMKEPWRDVEDAGTWLLQIRDRFQPDLVHLNSYAHGSLRWGVPVLVAGHSCIFSWWVAEYGKFPSVDWSRYHSAVSEGLRSAAHVAAPSAVMLAGLRHLYGPFEASSVVPNGRNPDHFSRASKEPFLLCAGRLWDSAKNIGSLLKIAPDLDWPLYVASGGEIGDGIDRNVAWKSAFYLGDLTTESLAGWMARASIFVAPARYDPFGVTILDAAFSRCALVLGDIPSLRENWQDAALFVPPQDIEALRNGVNQLIRDRDQREALARAARSRAECLTASRTAEDYMQVYESLCTAPSSSLTRFS